MPIRSKTSATERAGVNFVCGIVERTNCIFHEIDARNDYGNDAIVQAVEKDGSVRGHYAMMQIKSGSSYIGGTTCTISSTKDHFRYWSDHDTPVAGIVFDPDACEAHWIDISAFLAQHPDRLHSGPFSITFERNARNKLDDASFVHDFLPWMKRRGTMHLDRAVRYLHDEREDIHQFGVHVLVNEFGTSIAAWDALFYEYEHRTVLTRSIVFAVSMLGDHPDVFWRPGMVVYDDELRRRLCDRLRAPSSELVHRLMRVIDDSGIDRGTAGQCVDVILHEAKGLAPHFERVLKAETDPWTLDCTACLLAHLCPREALAVLDNLSDPSETIRMLQDALRSGEVVSLY